MTQYLDTRPYGEIFFHYIRLPDYVTDTDPVQFYAFSDSAYNYPIFEEAGPGRGAILQKALLAPGLLTLDEFTPTNYYAFMPSVEYLVAFTTTHTNYPSTRILLSMPEALIFDPDVGCEVLGASLNAQCVVNYSNNELTLDDLFTEIYPGGKQIRLTIKAAMNPIGSREAGGWSIQTLRPYEGDYYVVDGGETPSSFFALPGFIRCGIDYAGVDITFQQDTTFTFLFETEHDIPVGGFLQIELPD